MAQDRKERFRSDVRKALGLLRIKVDARGTGLDEDYVTRLIQGACIWLSGRVMEHFDPSDWPELNARDRRTLERCVARFKEIARSVNPKDGEADRAASVLVPRGRQTEAVSCLLTVGRIIGEDVRSKVWKLRRKIVATAARHGAYNVRVFGSVARGEADLLSDVDLLVDMKPGRSLFDLGKLLADLEDLLGYKVDVVTEKGLRQEMRERVLQEAVPL
jgi:predicted nucleotidyltransferase